MRKLTAFLAFLVGMSIGYYAGINFDERGFWQAYWLAISVFVSCVVYLCPAWEH